MATFLGSLELYPFDLVLQGQSGPTSAIIEKEEGCPYSHVGIYFDGHIYDAHPDDGVRKLPLSQYINQGNPSVPHLVLYNLNAHLIDTREGENLLKSWCGKKYNRHYDWEETSGLYCSQLVALFFNHFRPGSIMPKPMHFDRAREQWKAYFGDIRLPERQPGLSPCDLLNSPHFQQRLAKY